MAPVAEVDHQSARRYWDKLSFLQTSSTSKLAETAKASDKVDPIVIPETPTVENYEKSESGGVLGLMNKLRTEVKADLKEAEVEETNDLTLDELNSIKLYLRELDIECTFILKNYEARHNARVGEETGLEGAETIVTHEEPPAYEHNEEKYDQEHSAAEVDEHFPDRPMPKPMR